jgi:hypothetical protein
VKISASAPGVQARVIEDSLAGEAVEGGGLQTRRLLLGVHAPDGVDDRALHVRQGEGGGEGEADKLDAADGLGGEA